LSFLPDFVLSAAAPRNWLDSKPNVIMLCSPASVQAAHGPVGAHHRIPIALVNRITDDSIDELLADWGSRIRNAREAKGMSQEELGRAVGVGQSSVGHWERGMHEPAIWFKLALADVLGITPRKLFGWP
jgi:putative transcriptional regulator